MPKPLLSYRGLREALVSRLMDGDTINEGRHLYVGASEVGGCPRFVSWSKATRRVWTPDADSAGVMLPGRLVENEGVQLLRLMGLDSALSSTGIRQVKLRDENSALGCHPDGLLAADAFELDDQSTYFTEDGGIWRNFAPCSWALESWSSSLDPRPFSGRPSGMVSLSSMGIRPK
jgi:hypothetical protein